MAIATWRNCFAYVASAERYQDPLRALDDSGLLLQLIRDLAAYERAPNAAVATEEDLRRYGFGPQRQFEALLAFLDGEPAGFAMFHPRFSTWLGRRGVYLEDLFCHPSSAQKGGRRAAG